MSETKSHTDFICDGVLNYDNLVGRFEFNNTGKTVYANAVMMHIGPSDVMMCYQISKLNYKRLCDMSMPHRVPDPRVPNSLIEECRRRFLCGESEHCSRYEFTVFEAERVLLDDTEQARSYVEKMLKSKSASRTGDSTALEDSASANESMTDAALTSEPMTDESLTNEPMTSEPWFEVREDDVVEILERRKDCFPWGDHPDEKYRCLVYREGGSIRMVVDEFYKHGEGRYECLRCYTTIVCNTVEEYESMTEEDLASKAYSAWCSGAR